MTEHNTIRNPNLYQALKQYCRDEIDYLSKLVGHPAILFYTPTDLASDWHYKLKERSSLSTANRALHEDPSVSRHLDAVVSGRGAFGKTMTADEILQSFLRAQLDSPPKGLDGRSFNQDVFDDMFRRLEHFFHSDKVCYTCFAPLDRFSSEAGEFEIEKNLSLRRTPQDLRVRYFGQGIGPLSPSHAITFDEYLLEYRIEVTKLIGDIPDITNDDILAVIVSKLLDRVCSALRLIKTGSFGYSYLFVRDDSWEPSHMALISITWTTQPRLHLGPPYYFRQEDVNQFRAIYHNLQSLRTRKREVLQAALRRFNYGYERARPEDRFIDYLIAFESLLLNDSTTELTYKLAVRGAALLETQPDARMAVFDDLRNAYNARSSIVHGGISDPQIGKERVPLHSFVDKIEGYLRKALLLFLERSAKDSEKQILSELNRAIITHQD